MPTKHYILSGFGISVLLVFIIFLIPVHFPSDYSRFDRYTITHPEKFPRLLYYYSSLSPQELVTQRKAIKNNGFRGCIVAGLPTNWNADLVHLNTYRRDCKRLNRYFHQNYLAIYINAKDLPPWDDLQAWHAVLQNISGIAKFARKTGFAGIFVDTEDASLWDPEWNERYKTVSDDFASKIIYQRGREIIQAIESVFPHAAIIIYPLGVEEPPAPGGTVSQYEYWIHFANGMLSTKHTPFTLMTNRVCQTPGAYTDYRASINPVLEAKIDEKAFWHKELTISWFIRPIDYTSVWEATDYTSGFIALDIPSLNATTPELIDLKNPRTKLYLKQHLGKRISVLAYLRTIVYTSVRSFLRI
jgi:hypothetical protein